jgi:hypothetical protein
MAFKQEATAGMAATFCHQFVSLQVFVAIACRISGEI